MPEELIVESVARTSVETDMLRRAHRRMVTALILLTAMVAVCLVTTAMAVLVFAQQQRDQDQAARSVIAINHVTVAVGQCVKDPKVTDIRACLADALEVER